jgi:DNA repair exonuclease SbcCD ATPase subunit/predicted MPP superfamily phosphohydrolase
MEDTDEQQQINQINNINNIYFKQLELSFPVVGTDKENVTSTITKVKTIYHISDIHIHLYKRHKEYKQQFEKLYKYLRDEKAKKNIPEDQNWNIEMITVITGDILHSKSDLSPECIDLTYNFFKSIATIMPLVIIPGNHDLNMNNKNRLDSITPILADLHQTHPVYYLQQSGVYLYSNLVLMHASIHDYQILSVDIVNKVLDKYCEEGVLKLSDKKREALKTIALYHGRVNGCELFNGIKLEGEVSSNKKTITHTDFTGYDIGLCGDIHKQQSINQQGNVAYAGSLIQQNMGETIEGHGVLKWSVKSSTYKFKEIPNDFGYITLNLKNGELINVSLDNMKLPKNLRVRILYENTTNTEIEKFLEKLKSKYTVLEYNIQNAASVTLNSCSNYSNGSDVDANGGEDNGTNGNQNNTINNELDIRSVDFQNSLLEEIILDNYDNVKEEEIKEIKELNAEINSVVKEELVVNGNDDPNIGGTGIAGNRYKLRQLDFSNLYSYGANNVINFRELNGVVGIVAPNHMGKSAIIDIILYALFDKFPRKGSIKDMINIRKHEFHLKLIVECGYYEYIIEKSGKRTKAGSVSKAKCDFYRKNTFSGEMSNLSRDTVKETRDFIGKFFGNYEDIIHTNFSIQTDPTGFIDCENVARRKELERIMRFDYIELIVKKANKDIAACRAVINHLQETMKKELVMELQQDIATYEENLTNYTKELESKQTDLDKYQEQLTKLNQQLNLNVDEQIDKCLSALDVDDVENLSMDAVDAKLREVKEALCELDNTLSLELTKLKKMCKRGVVQRLDVPKKDDILDFCDEATLEKILDYKKLMKSFIKEYKQWAKDQNIEKQVKLTSLNKKIRTLEKKLGTYQNDLVRKVTDEDGITDKEIREEFTIIISDINKQISNKKKEVDEYDKIEKDISSYQKKITKSEKVIKGFETEILELVNKKMPLDLLEKIKTYQSSVLQSNKYADVDVLSKFDNAIDSKSIDSVSELKEIYEYEQDKGFTSWTQRYISTNDTIDVEIEVVRGKITKENKKIIKNRDKITEAEKELKGREELLKEITGLEASIKVINKDISTYEANQILLSEITDVEREREALETELASGSSEINDFIDDIDTTWTNIKDEIIKRKDMELEISSLEKVSSGLDELLVQVEKNTELQEQILEISTQRDKLQKDFNDLNQECQTIRDKCALGKGRLDKMIVDCQLKEEKIRLMDLLGIYKKAMTVIPMILINKIKPVLSRKVNDLLSVVTNFNLEFDFDDNKVDIYLHRPAYKERKIIINNSSGFERFISSLAIRLALMEISKLPSPNVMIIDEGWSCFDNENLHNLDVILDHLGQRFDFILTISHLTTIRQHCDTQIGLVKDDAGYSVVRYG